MKNIRQPATTGARVIKKSVRNDRAQREQQGFVAQEFSSKTILSRSRHTLLKLPRKPQMRIFLGHDPPIFAVNR